MARAVVDELTRGGARLIVISPGSRSTALAVAAVEHPGLETVVALDERSAGFHALGRSKADGRPAGLICTSGTAAANYFPAVVEADMSMTPLMVMTADRPAELRGVGANQTIDQVELFGSKVRFFHDVPAPGADDDLNDRWRTIVARALAAATGVAPGPVHLNIAFREPTAPVSNDGRSTSPPYEFGIDGRDGGAPWVERARSSPPAFAEPLSATSRGVVIAGDGEYDRSGLLRASAALGWPVLATALSGLRSEAVISSYHHLLVDGVPDGLGPDVVVAVGAIGPSPRLELLVSSAATRVRVDRWGRVIDPGRDATAVIHADPVDLLSSIPPAAEDGWASGWAATADLVDEAIGISIAGTPRHTGAAVVRALNDVDWARLVSASSLPIREVDAHLRVGGQVVANRGASGIDGFVSTALGAASAGGRTVALAGDLSLLHDSNGFLIDETPHLVLIVLDNGGGGLFDTMPQAAHAPFFERLFLTPHGRDLARLAGLHDIDYLDIAGGLAGEVESRLASGGLHLLRIGIDRDADVKLRARLDAISREKLESADP